MKIAAKKVVVAFVWAASSVFGNGALLYLDEAIPPAAAAEVPETPTTQRAAKGFDPFGDPLPAGAMARIGTLRFRPGVFIGALVYSPDGKRIASASGRKVQLWETATGKELRAWEFPTYGEALAFSPDSEMLAVSTWGKLCVLDIDSGRELRSWPGYGRALAFSPDGCMLAAEGSRFAPTIYLRDLVTGKEVRKWLAKSSPYWMKFAGDGKSLLTRSLDQTVRTWDVATGTEITAWKIDGPANTGTGIDMTRDGKIIASPAANGSICLYEVATGKKLHAWPAKGGGPVAFSPDGNLLASAEEGGVHLRAVGTGKEVCTCPRDRSYFPALAFAPDGKAVAAGEADSTIRQWHVPSGKEILVPGHDGPVVYSAAFMPGSTTLATVGTDYKVRLWDATTGQETRNWTAETTEFSWITFSPNGRLLAARGDDRMVRLWDVATGKELLTWKHHARSHAFSPDGKVLAARTAEAKIILWDVATGQQLRAWQDLAGHHGMLAFSPDGKSLVCGGYEQAAIGLWEPTTGTLVREFKRAGQACVFALAFSPDGRSLAVVGHDNSVRLWETLTGQEIRTWTFAAGSVAFTPDGQALAVGGRDGTIRLWDLATGNELWVGKGHRSSVQTVAFSSNGQMLASASHDTTALLWDLSGRVKPQRAPAAPLTAEHVQSHWTELAGTDARKGVAAIHALAARPKQTVPLLAEHLKPVPAVAAQKIEKWIADLSSNEFQARQQASEELEKLGELAEPALRRALAERPPLEMAQRLGRLLEKAPTLRVPPAELLRALRAVQVLEQIGTPEAQEVLKTLARGAAGARLTNEAQAALTRGGKPQ